MFKHIGVRNVKITSDSREIAKAHKIILPGVGAFDTGMSNLMNLSLIDILNQKALVEKVPFLGICLGMQLMTSGSEEGLLDGLGWFSAKTVKFSPTPGLKVPHMGWNQVVPSRDHPVWAGIKPGSSFYFVHSYFPNPKAPELILAQTDYGIRFASALGRDNLVATQFHPEKSGKVGLELLANFLSWDP